MSQTSRRAEGSLDESALGGVLRDALLPFAVSRILMAAVATFANSYLLPWAISRDLEASGIDLLLDPWNRFDSAFYLEVATNGYGDAGSATWGIFPLFPLVVHLVASVLGGSEGAFLLAAMLVANLAAAGATALLYVLVRAEWDQDVAKRTVLYFCFVPFGFFLAAPYADSLFVLLTIATVLLVRQHRWMAAGTVGALAALTRPPGALLAIVLVAELISVRRARAGSRSATPVGRPLLAAALVPGGLVAFLAYANVSTGSWLTTQRVSAGVWGRDITAPWDGFDRLVEAAHWGEPASYLFTPGNLVLLVAVGYVLTRMVRILPAAYSATTAVLLIAAMSYGTLQSFGRHALALFPALVVVALATRSERSLRHQLVLTTFASANVVLLICYVLNIPAVA